MVIRMPGNVYSKLYLNRSMYIYSDNNGKTI